MSMLTLFTLGGLVAVAFLGITLQRLLQNDRFAAMAAKRRASAKVSSRADLVDGRQHIPVSLTLDSAAVIYENDDLEAKLPIEQIDEVEYDNELATGGHIESGRVLRLRSHGQAFEFALDDFAAREWAAHLPAHRMDEPGRVQAR